MIEIRDKNLCSRVPVLLPNKDTHFIDCNLLNCILDPSCMATRCLQLKKEYCSHLHPEYVEEGLLECSDDCIHAVRTTDAVVIDGVTVVAGERVYADKTTLMDGTVRWEE